MSDVLDYQTPANELRLQRIARALRARQSFFWVKVTTMLSIGVAAGFLGPAVVTWIARVVCERQKIEVGWLTLFNLSCLVMLPLLYWLELRTRGNFLTDELRAQGHSIEEGYRTILSSRGELRQSGALYAIYVEAFLFGPRMTIDAVRRLRARMGVRRPSVQRAAEVVMLLSVAGGSVEVQRLDRGEGPEELQALLTYLMVHDWIDVGDGGRRVWLPSMARRRVEL